MPPTKKPETVKEAPRQLQPGDAVLMPDGGAAILLGFDEGEALLRCGTSHGEPHRRPAGQCSFVEPADESRLHRKFRADALSRGEIELSEPASAEHADSDTLSAGVGAADEQ